jgi:hypothetical protein
MKIGQIDNESPLGLRDAFHVPSVLVRSYQRLKAGDKVRFTDDSFKEVVPAGQLAPHAIIDPFVKPFKTTEQVWALLMPDSIGKLNHVFELKFEDVPKAYVPEPEPVEGIIEYDGCRGCW